MSKITPVHKALASDKYYKETKPSIYDFYDKRTGKKISILKVVKDLNQDFEKYKAQKLTKDEIIEVIPLKPKGKKKSKKYTASDEKRREGNKKELRRINRRLKSPKPLSDDLKNHLLAEKKKLVKKYDEKPATFKNLIPNQSENGFWYYIFVDDATINKRKKEVDKQLAKFSETARAITKDDEAQELLEEMQSKLSEFTA